MAFARDASDAAESAVLDALTARADAAIARAEAEAFPRTTETLC